MVVVAAVEVALAADEFPERKFDENLEGARRLAPVRAPPPSLPDPLVVEVLTLILLRHDGQLQL